MRDELSLLQAQLTYKKRLEAMLTELRAQEAPLRTKVTELEQIMLRERKDVDRLEGRSLAAFFYFCIGRKTEKLDVELAEDNLLRLSCVTEAGVQEEVLLYLRSGKGADVYA